AGCRYDFRHAVPHHSHTHIEVVHVEGLEVSTGTATIARRQNYSDNRLWLSGFGSSDIQLGNRDPARRRFQTWLDTLDCRCWRVSFGSVAIRARNPSCGWTALHLTDADTRIDSPAAFAGSKRKNRIEIEFADLRHTLNEI